MYRLFQNKIFKIIMKTIKIVFLVFLTLYFSFVLIEKISYHTSFFGYRVFTVSSNSMKKVYSLNDVLLVKKVKVKKIKEGMDIAYIGEQGGLSGKVILNRLVKIEKGEKETVCYTQGVSSPTVDPPISQNKVLGKVVGKVFFFSELNHIVKRQEGFFFLIFCPLVLLITLEVLKTITDIKIEKGRLQETERLSLTEIIKLNQKQKKKRQRNRNLENTYHEIPLIVESIPLMRDSTLTIINDEKSISNDDKDNTII